MKDNHVIQTSVFEDKLTVAETSLLAKYFHRTDENTWKPSLIAFPHFQTFPSRVHKVMHGCRTGMLIDTMQHLQGLSFSADNKTTDVEVLFNSFCSSIFLLLSYTILSYSII